MKNKRTILIFGGLICFLLVVLGTNWLRTAREKVEGDDCRSHLYGIAFCVRVYSDEHDHEFPQDLQQVVNTDGSLGRALFLLVCPGTGKSPGGATNVVAWTDYYYVPVAEESGGTTNCALIYDRSLFNHSGKGINVMVVGTPHMMLPSASGLFWDPDAEWLKNFAARHPNYAILIPK